MVTGVILAGGQSRRLGRDKASTSLAGRPLALWVAAALAPLVQDILLISNRPELHERLGLPLVTDLIPGLGALGGLLTGLFYAPRPLVVLTACDAPFLQPELVRLLITTASSRRTQAAVASTERGLEPLPAAFHSRLFPRLEDHLKSGDYRLRSFLSRCRTRVLTPEEVSRADPTGASFLNINTPADLRAAEKLAAALPCPILQSVNGRPETGQHCGMGTARQQFLCR